MLLTQKIILVIVAVKIIRKIEPVRKIKNRKKTIFTIVGIVQICKGIASYHFLKTSNIWFIIINQLNHLIECIRTFLKLHNIELSYIPAHDTNMIGLFFLIEGRRKSEGNNIVYMLVR